MEELRAPVLEFRSAADHRSGWITKGDLYASFRKPIDPSVDKNMKAIPRKQRAMVRKGIQNGLRSEIDRDADRLHRVYGESVRNLGTPVFPKKYFELLLDDISEHSDIVTITTGEGKPVASVLNFYFRDEVLPYYGGGTSDARRLAANDFMYWEVMRRACERGYRVFDFGRSKIGTGAYDFKTYWGFEPTPLVYQFRLAAGQKMPDLNPLNPKFALFVKNLEKAAAGRGGTDRAVDRARPWLSGRADMKDMLFLAHRIPYPPDKGDKIRAWNMLRHLAEQYRVHLATFIDAPEDVAGVEPWRRICASVVWRKLSPRRAKLRSLAGLLTRRPADAILFRRPAVACRRRPAGRRPRPALVMSFARRWLRTFPISGRTNVLDMVDVDSEKWRQYAETGIGPRA